MSEERQLQESSNSSILYPALQGRLWKLAGTIFEIGAFFIFYWILMLMKVLADRFFGVGPDGEVLLSNAGFDAFILVCILVAGGAAVATFLAGRATHLRGRKILALAMAGKAAEDSRPPVLYLRSFQDDQKAAVSPGESGLQMFTGTAATEEEQLCRALSELGPFITIGRPGEKLPELGAARFYVSHEEWQDRVRELMNRSQLVVLRVGQTPGFFWEVQRAAQSIAPQKLVFLLPYSPDIYEQFRSLAADSFPRGLPEFDGGPSLAGSYLGGVLHFEPDWTPHILKFKVPFYMTTLGIVLNPPMWSFREFRLGKPFVSILKRTLNPVLRVNGLKWKWPPWHPLLSVQAWAMILFWTFAIAGWFGLRR